MPRRWLYNKENPSGKLFTITDEQTQQMLADGWVENRAALSSSHPTKLEREQVKPKVPTTNPAKTETEPKPIDLADLTQIKGIGPALQTKLNAEGVTNLNEIAALSDSDIKLLDEKLSLKNRIWREEWVKQAHALLPPAEPGGVPPLAPLKTE